MESTAVAHGELNFSSIDENQNSHAICFSHLRWDFVFQRPQHLIQRLAAEMPVIFWEEPIFQNRDKARLELIAKTNTLTIARLLLPEDTKEEACVDLQRHFLDEIIVVLGIEKPVCWYYSPLMLRFSDHLQPACVIYDCMDELSAFKGAHPHIAREEQRLFSRADLVFTAALVFTRRSGANTRTSTHSQAASISRISQRRETNSRSRKISAPSRTRGLAFTASSTSVSTRNCCETSRRKSRSGTS